MGVFRLYAEIVKHLTAYPDGLTEQSLDAIAAVYSPYAYIGNRKSLRELVLRDAQRLESCEQNVQAQSAEELAAWWFNTRKWQTDSGAFPDFVLAWGNTGTLGDGAVLELKDSRSQAIASFNSTLPSARKRISKLEKLVKGAVERYERCLQSTGPDERDCFYLIRTHKHDTEQCRLSLVHGTFFETIPTHELLTELWRQVLGQAEVPDELKEQVLDRLAQLDRADIAQTRKIPSASIKPRLRIMSEIHTEGNPHTYPKICPRSVNLIFKLPESEAQTKSEAQSQVEELVMKYFRQEGVQVSNKIQINGTSIDCFEIQHRRNGLHVVVQAVVQPPSQQPPAARMPVGAP